MIIKYLEKTVRLDLLDKWLSAPSVKVLDIGCGNHSASTMKKYYPDCKYYGLDLNKNFNNNASDFDAMENFYEIDLNSKPEELDIVPNDFFDCIILSHTIEHLKNGEDILLRLSSKLKKRGILYIETPAPRTLNFPNFKVGLNFYSDPTHIKVYPVSGLEKFLNNNGFSVISLGTRRSLKRIVFFPFYALGSLVRYKYLSAGVFYDIVGFADYLIAYKN